MESSAIQIELREHDRRISGLHRTVGGLSTSVASHETDIEVSKTNMSQVKEDIADIKRDVANGRKEQRDEMAKVRWGLWAAAGTFLAFFIATATLVVQLST